MNKVVSNKRILLRVDLNSDIKNGRVLESERVSFHAKTIKSLIKNNNKVVILAHQSHEGKNSTLYPHFLFLKKYLGKKIKFVKDTIGKNAVREIKNLEEGEALLLENVRFVKEELNPSEKNKFVKILSPLFDLYINDAFSVCHRNQTSVASFQKVLPGFKGENLKEELKNLEKIKSKVKDCLFVFGGVKAEDLMPLINHKSLTSGELGSLALMSKGYNLGYEKTRWKKDLSLISKIKPFLKNMKTPLDVAIEEKGKRKELTLNELPSNKPFYDIGKNTIDLYKKEIRKAKIVLFKGAPGRFQDKKFEIGTKTLLNEIAKSKSFKVIAGGHSLDALQKFKISKDKFDYVSFSGGALVSYLAGEKMWGLENLE